MLEGINKRENIECPDQTTSKWVLTTTSHKIRGQRLSQCYSSVLWQLRHIICYLVDYYFYCQVKK